ncbi:hypothetical protein HHK36_007781 [Tetracentron sinense]|uniref:J domain-containing protein n=1 Tax=Tetracentron sinense TaxID=13715 RepID=A0A834ZED0_TETSI|nr:hypothetical protein HHK36_007781 [Tetracentron sinense]
MGDQPSSTPPDYHNVLGITKGASIRDVAKAYKSLVMRWHPDKHPVSNKIEAEAKFKAINEAYGVYTFIHIYIYIYIYICTHTYKQEDQSMYGVHDHGDNGGGGSRGDEYTTSNDFFKHRSVDNHFSSTPSPLSKSASRRNNSSTVFPTSLPKSISRRSTNSIMFSHSARRKPPPIEKKLECTLEELCNGCIKKIKITRDVVTNTGIIVQEEELLRIKVKPGWKKGTKITFEGMGDERPGTLPADITFLIAEKRHPLFKREGDELVLAIEIPLVKALTGCTLSIPLLGGEKMSLLLDDIIYPGYEKIIPDQGMPNPKEQGRRGDLRIKFLIIFPKQLSDEQRTDILNLLQDSF